VVVRLGRNLDFATSLREKADGQDQWHTP